VSIRMRTVSLSSGSGMMAEEVAVDAETVSSGESGSAQHSPDFKDPLGVNYHLCAAVDDESDEFDFDVSTQSAYISHLSLSLSLSLILIP